MLRCPWARQFTLTARDELAVTLHGWLRRRCVHEWVNVSQYCKALWVATGEKHCIDAVHLTVVQNLILIGWFGHSAVCYFCKKDQSKEVAKDSISNWIIKLFWKSIKITNLLCSTTVRSMWLHEWHSMNEVMCRPSSKLVCMFMCCLATVRPRSSSGTICAGGAK